MNVKKIGSWLVLGSVVVAFPICMIGFVFAFDPTHIYLNHSLFSFVSFILVPLAVLGTLMIFIGDRKHPKIRGQD